MAVAYRGLIPDETLDRLSVKQRADVPAVYVAVKGGVTVGFCAVAALGQDDGVAEIGAIYVERRFGSADSRCRSKLECSNRETFS